MARTALQGSSFASLVTGGRPSRPLGPLKGYALSQMTRCGGEGPLPDPATSVYYACGFTRRCHTHGGCKGAAPGLRNYTYMGYSVRAAEWSWDVIILTSGGAGANPDWVCVDPRSRCDPQQAASTSPHQRHVYRRLVITPPLTCKCHHHNLPRSGG